MPGLETMEFVFRAAIGKGAAIGFERLPAAASVKLEIADLQGEVDAVLRIGCNGQSAARKRDRLVLPEEGVRTVLGSARRSIADNLTGGCRANRVLRRLRT
jgi:hypothetical protein